MNKHAYLIIAHNNPDLLGCLISQLDDVRNDIFIHVDSKASIETFQKLKTRHSGLYFTDRIDVRWAHISLVKAEFILMKAATSIGKYAYYHLLSGVDFPIKTQDYIHDFFIQHNGRNFVGILNKTDSDNIASKRCDTYSFFLAYQRHNKFGYFVKALNTYLVGPFQKLIGIKRVYPWQIKVGPQWFSITDDFCRYVISQETEVYKAFRYCTCVDEMFIQTLIWNSKYRVTLYISEGQSNEATCRLIDWSRGTPYTYKVIDMREIMESRMIFCRKIVDLDLAYLISRELCNH